MRGDTAILIAHLSWCRKWDLPRAKRGQPGVLKTQHRCVLPLTGSYPSSPTSPYRKTDEQISYANSLICLGAGSGTCPAQSAASPGYSKRNTVAFCPLQGRTLQVPLRHTEKQMSKLATLTRSSVLVPEVGLAPRKARPARGTQNATPLRFAPYRVVPFKSHFAIQKNR